MGKINTLFPFWEELGGFENKLLTFLNAHDIINYLYRLNTKASINVEI